MQLHTDGTDCVPAPVGKTTTPRRIKLARRAGWQCMWCNQTMRAELGFQNTCTVEHIVPASKGGSNGMSNLGSACARCNKLRGCTPADEFKLIAVSFKADGRCAQQAERARLRDIRRRISQGLMDPPRRSPSKIREREDKQAARAAWIADNHHNPFDVHSRRWRMFEKLKDNHGDWYTRRTAQTTHTAKTTVWQRVINWLRAWWA